MTDRKLKIAVLSRNFDPRGGGAERYSWAVAHELAKKHELHIFAQSFATQHTETRSELILHKIPGPLRRPRWVNQLWFALSTWWLTRKNFDVVNSHEHSWHGDVQTFHVLPIRYKYFLASAGLKKLLKSIKLLTSLRLLTYWFLEALRLQSFAGRKRLVVTTSPLLSQAISQAYPETQANILVIRPGVATPPIGLAINRQAARHHLGLPSAAKVALLVANDPIKKGLLVLLQALAHLPSQWILAVAGHVPTDTTHKQLAVQLGVEDRLFFLGSQTDLSQAFQASDVLTHPTTEDTYAMVVLESMAHGLPVIVSASPYCGISDDLVHMQEALLITDPHQSEEIANLMTLVFAQPDLAASLVKAGRAFAQKHTWQVAANAHETAFFKLLSDRR